jgi:hypothetical protein
LPIKPTGLNKIAKIIAVYLNKLKNLIINQFYSLSPRVYDVTRRLRITVLHILLLNLKFYV